MTKVLHACWLLDPWRPSRDKYVAAWHALGFEVRLWHLGQLATEVPNAASMDANEILNGPIHDAFKYEEVFRVHAACADLFRYEVLLRHGGTYADLDVFPRNLPDDVEEPRFEKDRHGKLEIRYLSSPPKHELMQRLRDEAVQQEAAFMAKGGYKTKRDLLGVLSRTGPHMAMRVARRWAEENSASYPSLLLPRVVNANTWENRREHYSRRWTEVREKLNTLSKE